VSYFKTSYIREKKESLEMHAREQILPGTCILGSGGMHKLGE